MRYDILQTNVSVHTATYRCSTAVRPSKRPSGRVVRSLSHRFLWVSREDGDEPRRDDTLAADNVLLPYMVIGLKGIASPRRCTGSDARAAFG